LPDASQVKQHQALSSEGLSAIELTLKEKGRAFSPAFITENFS
jgi:hypothetical protein